MLREANLEAQMAAMRHRYRVLPLEYMLDILNHQGSDPDVTIERRDWAAAQSMGYVHPKLASVDVRQVQPQPRWTIDLSKLTEPERIEFRRLMAKAQTQLIEAKPGTADNPIDITPRVVTEDA